MGCSEIRVSSACVGISISSEHVLQFSNDRFPCEDEFDDLQTILPKVLKKRFGESIPESYKKMDIHFGYEARLGNYDAEPTEPGTVVFGYEAIFEVVPSKADKEENDHEFEIAYTYYFPKDCRDIFAETLAIFKKMIEAGGDDDLDDDLDVDAETVENFKKEFWVGTSYFLSD